MTYCRYCFRWSSCRFQGNAGDVMPREMVIVLSNHRWKFPPKILVFLPPKLKWIPSKISLAGHLKTPPLAHLWLASLLSQKNISATQKYLSKTSLPRISPQALPSPAEGSLLCRYPKMHTPPSRLASLEERIPAKISPKTSTKKHHPISLLSPMLLSNRNAHSEYSFQVSHSDCCSTH